MKPIALVTCASSLPIDFDMPILLNACKAIGLTETEVCDWQNSTVDWSRFGAIVLRSPWNYVDLLPEFLAWCESVSLQSQLLNPLLVARWSLDKHYLVDLAAYGVPIVPSRFVKPGANPGDAYKSFLDDHLHSREIVIKPTVGAYSQDVQRFTRERTTDAVDYLTKLLGRGDVILQPYFTSIDHLGETDLTYFDGTYSHAIRKAPMLMPDGTVNVPTQDMRESRIADPAECAVASSALAAAAAHLGLDRPLLYGRVDLIRGDDGTPVVLELEVCEPSLNLPFSTDGALRFAEAIARRVEA